MLKYSVKEPFSDLGVAAFSGAAFKEQQMEVQCPVKDTLTGHQADGHIGCLHGSNL